MRAILIAALLLLSACSLEQQNGDLRIEPAPLFRDQPWKITQQKTVGTEKVCILSAGEIEVTLRKRGKETAEQVATNHKLHIGEGYKIRVGDGIYRTATSTFTSKESRVMIQQFLNAEVAYTEWSQLVNDNGGSVWKRWSNTISLAGFTKAYQTCEKFVGKQTKKS